MILERTKTEILIRMPANVDLTELQDMLDYLNYKEQTANSKALQDDVDELAETVNESIWTKFKAQRKLK
jgi:hypothetical protein